MTETDLEQFVSLRTERMLRLAYLLSGVAHTAEDLVQEALLRCHRRWERVASVANPDAYLRRIIANQHLTWRRRRSSTALMVQPDHVPEEDAADSQDTLTVQDLLWGRCSSCRLHRYQVTYDIAGGRMILHTPGSLAGGQR
jgi:DNA-directed RNA polymerase specialized sigma24 family protein